MNVSSLVILGTKVTSDWVHSSKLDIRQIIGTRIDTIVSQNPDTNIDSVFFVYQQSPAALSAQPALCNVRCRRGALIMRPENLNTDCHTFISQLSINGTK